MNTYDCTCGWVESDEWYAPYPLHNDSCPIQVRLVDEVTVWDVVEVQANA